MIGFRSEYRPSGESLSSQFYEERFNLHAFDCQLGAFCRHDFEGDRDGDYLDPGRLCRRPRWTSALIAFRGARWSA